MIRYFRRTLETRVGALEEAVIYAVREVPVEERTDPVRVVAGFPVNWRPTENPGQVLHDPASTERVWLCEVPRNQFRHYEEIPQEAAIAAYAEFAGPLPSLGRQPAMA